MSATQFLSSIASYLEFGNHSLVAYSHKVWSVHKGSVICDYFHRLSIRPSVLSVRPSVRLSFHVSTKLLTSSEAGCYYILNCTFYFYLVCVCELFKDNVHASIICILSDIRIDPLLPVLGEGSIPRRASGRYQ